MDQAKLYPHPPKVEDRSTVTPFFIFFISFCKRICTRRKLQLKNPLAALFEFERKIPANKDYLASFFFSQCCLCTTLMILFVVCFRLFFFRGKSVQKHFPKHKTFLLALCGLNIFLCLQRKKAFYADDATPNRIFAQLKRKVSGRSKRIFVAGSVLCWSHMGGKVINAVEKQHQLTWSWCTW